MSKMKILYFDYWTVGINNFSFFNHKLTEKGFETKLVHLNSWKGIKTPEFQTLNGIECFDIAYYETNLIYNVLKRESPAVVVMLNASFITDRTVILACKKLGIKCVYLAHGSLTRAEFIDSSINALNQTLKKGRVIRAIKHFRGTLINYLHALVKFNPTYLFRPHGYKVIANTFLNPGRYLLFPPHSFDLEPDRILVYGHTEREFFLSRLGDGSDKVRVTGMPDLDNYFQNLPSLGTNRDQFLTQNNIPTDRPFVTYIEEGLVQDKVWDEEYSQSFFETISIICKEAGYHLAIKLHPRTARSPYRKAFDNLRHATIIDQIDFPKLVYFSEKCISHYSTTLIYPFLLDKPVLVPRWGKSSELLKWFSDEEVTYITTLEEFQRRIADSANSFDYNRVKYLKTFVPFTDGKTGERIANYILEIIS